MMSKTTHRPLLRITFLPHLKLPVIVGLTRVRMGSRLWDTPSAMISETTHRPLLRITSMPALRLPLFLNRLNTLTPLLDLFYVLLSSYSRFIQLQLPSIPKRMTTELLQLSLAKEYLDNDIILVFLSTLSALFDIQTQRAKGESRGRHTLSQCQGSSYSAKVSWFISFRWTLERCGELCPSRVLLRVECGGPLAAPRVLRLDLLEVNSLFALC